MSGPSVYLSWPTRFTPLPDNLPPALPPPVKERSFRSPFGIDKDLFNFALEPWLPVTFAATYITAVFVLNAYNRNRNHKPWWIARQKPFQWFVVLHNVLLCVYSTATFAAMFRAIRHTLPHWDNANGPAAFADALCKMHGPRGLGDAATFNTTLNIWEVKNTAIRLGYDGNPDPTDFGRLWNEGLAFWGWIFYVSKFYEVVDTLIILAKGRRSATLQTYHHAGAMLCMWAGIRYMSPPIWMFVFINSFIHALMYLYFSLSALGYKVPQSLKRTLTSLQIAQFVFGASYAAAHLFVSYDIPVKTPYQVASTLQRAASSVSSAAEEATSIVSSVIASPTARDMGAFLKKMLLRAAGEEGIAERVRDDRNQLLLSPKIEEKIERFNEQTFETRWRTEWTKVNCIDTTGEAFAIYLNLLYLAPLTALFARFFYKAYTQRGRARTASQAARKASESAQQAENETERYIEEHGERAEEEIAQRGPEAAEKVRKKAQDLHEQLRKDVEEMKQGKFKGSRRVSDRVASFEGKAKDTVKAAIEKVQEEGGPYVEKAEQMGGKAKEDAKKLVNGSSTGSGSGNGNNKPSERSTVSPQNGGTGQSTDESQPSSAPSTPNKKNKKSKGKQQAGEKAPESAEKAKAQADKSADQMKADSDDKDSDEANKENEPPKAEDSAAGKDEAREKKNDASRGKDDSDKADPTGQAGKGKAREKKNDASKGKDDSDKADPTGQAEAMDVEPFDQSKSDDSSKPGESETESKEKQDANLEASTEVRPGAAEGEDDTDAMGKSGVNVDKGGDEEEEEEDPTAGAEPAGAQWEKPGSTAN